MMLGYCKQKGLRVSRASLPPGYQHKKEQVSSAEEKAGLTFIGFITHDTSIQPKLPQILLGNEHVFTLKLLAELSHVTPSNFRVWRKVSSWNNHSVMCQILALLKDCLKDYSGTHQIILVMDVARCHFHTKIFSLANRLGIRLVYVPRKLTWLLQPLDTHCFARLKRLLKEKWVELRVASESGVVSHAAWLAAVFDIVKKLFCGTKWLPAFRALLDETAGFSARVQKELGWKGPRPIPSEALSEEQLKSIFPQKARVNRGSLLKWCLPEPKAKPKATAKAKAGASPSAASSSSDAFVAVAEHPSAPISSGTRAKKRKLMEGLFAL
jgi:hypothetical protein